MFPMMMVMAAALVLGGLGCKQPRAQVILMPEKDGRVGVVEVRNAGGAQILDQAFHGVWVVDDQHVPRRPVKMEESRIQEIFGPAIDARPNAPEHYILHFEVGSVGLCSASRHSVRRILDAIRERHSIDISVVGHTDTAGSDELNNALARKRAEVVAKLLMEAGVEGKNLEITSHGKSMPLVKTGDHVLEPRNRRVEVTVR